MSSIQVLDKTFVPYLSKKMIEERLDALALELKKDYEGKKPLFISILNGSFIYASDLFRKLDFEAEISFIKLASYKGMRSTGSVVTAIGLETPVKGREVIILEDIIDTGRTMHSFLPELKNQQPASLKIAVLLHKVEATEFEVPIDYCCFKIPNKFVVGYGLDYDGYGRNIPEIFQLA